MKIRHHKFKLLVTISLSITLAALTGCRRGGPDENKNTTPNTESIIAIQNDAQGMWKSDCTRLTSLNIPTIPATISKSAYITAQGMDTDQVTITLTTFPGKVDCTLNTANFETANTYSRTYTSTIKSILDKHHATMELVSTDPCDDKNTFNIEMKFNDKEVAAKLLGATFHSVYSNLLKCEVTEGQDGKLVIINPNKSATQSISGTSPLLKTSLKLKRVL